MKYTVFAVNEKGRRLWEYDDLDINEATVYADDSISNDHQIFIEWFRSVDGQSGYLNRDGHSPVGKAW